METTSLNLRRIEPHETAQEDRVAALERAPAHGSAPPALSAPLASAFDGVVRLALIELSEGQIPYIGEALGLEASDLAVLVDFLPPSLARALHSVPVERLIALESEEAALLDLLMAECALPDAPGRLVSRITSRRAMRNDHLWQDMGLPDRASLSHLVALAWPELHAKNTSNMRWKRFFYRALCEAEGFSLCSVPHCRDCTEYNTCFGEESGESAFARRVAQREAVKAAK